MKNRILTFMTGALLAGAAGISAQTGASLNFDGIDDHVYLGNSLNSQLESHNTITVEAWVNPSGNTGNKCIISNYNTDFINAEMQFLLRTEGDGYAFWVDDGGTNGWQSVHSGAGTLTLNSWQHVAATWNGSAISVYLDGTLMATNTGVNGPGFIASANSIRIGFNDAGENFEGTIDEVRLWTSCRTAAEIQASMSCSVMPETPGLLAYYTFNDGAANGNNAAVILVHDRSGNSFDGILLALDMNGTVSNFTDDVRSDYLSPHSIIGSINTIDHLYSGTAADFDGDGANDLLVYDNNNNTRLYLNDGQGNFSSYSNITAGIGGPCSAADVDGDGDIDFAMANNLATVRIYINNGAAAFTPITISLNGTGAAAVVKLADLNNDMKTDLVIGNSSGNATDQTELWLNTGTTGNAAFTFSAGLDNTMGPRSSIAISDLDGDNDPDIYTGGTGGWPAGIFLNNANNGSFTQATAPAGYSGQIELTDWDHDGDADALAYDNYNNAGLRVFTNDGAGNFGPASAPLLQSATYTSFALQDVNADGFADVVVNNYGGTAKVFLNTGCALALQTDCAYALGYADNGVVVSDFDGDGTPDIFCLGTGHHSTLYKNFLEPVSTTPALPVFTAGAGVSSCEGTAADLSAGSLVPLTYEWYTSLTGVSPVSTGSPYSVNQPAGTYTYYVDAVNSNGCHAAHRDSVLLTVHPQPLVTTTLNDPTVSANENGAAYQWLDCNNSGAVIAGATAQSFTAPANGSYAVQVTLNGCTDTSACVTIASVGLNNIELMEGSKVYPNPARDQVTVTCKANTVITLVNTIGQTLVEIKASSNSIAIDTGKFSSGVYFLKTENRTERTITRLILE